MSDRRFVSPMSRMLSSSRTPSIMLNNCATNTAHELTTHKLNGGLYPRLVE